MSATSDHMPNESAAAGSAIAEAKYRSLIEGVNDLVFVILVPSGRYEYVSPSALAVVGYDAAEIQAEPFFLFRVVHSDSREAIEQTWARTLKGIVDPRLDFKLVDPAGRVRWISASRTAIRNGEGRLIAVEGICRDVTQQREAEDEARRSAELLRTVVAGAPAVIYALDRDGVFTLSEGLGLAALGLRPGEVVGRSAFELYGSIPGFREAFDRALSGSQSALASTVGGVEFEAVYAPSRNAAGEVVGVIGVAFDVNERKRGERALHEREQRYASLVAALTEGVVIQDRSGAIVTCNQSACRILGLTEDELLGRTSVDPRWATLREDGSPFPGHDHPAMQTLRTGQPIHDVTMSVCRPDGSHRWLLVNSQPVFGEADGPATAAVTSFRDVTDARRRQLELQRARERAEVFHQLVEAAGQGIGFATPELRVVYLNGALMRMLDVRSSVDVGHWHVDEFYTDESRDVLRRVVLPALEAQGVWSGEMTMRSLTGRLIPSINTIFPLKNERCEIVAVANVLVDITDRRRAEEALRRNEARLKEAQRLARAGSWDFDLRSGRLDWSDEVFRIFELDAATVVPSFDLFLDTVHPEDRQSVREAYEASVDGVGPYSVTHRLLMPDGRVKYVHEEGRTEYDADGRPVRSHGSCQDVTERVTAERALETSLREKDMLLREVHHRVKNNLQIVSSLLYFQEKRARTRAGAETFADSRHRLRSMMLVHEKLYRSGNLSNVGFDDYVRSLVADLHQSLVPRPRQIELGYDLEPVPLSLEQAVPLGMIVSELVTNAFKHAFPKGCRGAVRLTMRARGRTVEVVAADDGIGLPEGFDHTSGETFGWQLVRNLVAQIGGRIDVERQAGTRVRIVFERGGKGSAA